MGVWGSFLGSAQNGEVLPRAVSQALWLHAIYIEVMPNFVPCSGGIQRPRSAQLL